MATAGNEGDGAVDGIVESLLEMSGPQMQAPSAGTAVCPSCPKHPLLERFPRYEVVTYEPLRYCPFCYGFWARGDSLSRGVADPYTDHPALRNVPVPACRACRGRLGPDLKCRKCGWTPPPLGCPVCRNEMQRVRVRTVTLDLCAGCKGIWFETGEIVALYGLANEPASLVARAFPAAPEGEGPAGVDVADIIALVLSFAPLL